MKYEYDGYRSETNINVIMISEFSIIWVDFHVR